MRVLLATLNAKYIHVNLALRYLQACCRELPLEFILEEFTINDRPENIAARIYRHRPDLAAFSCYIWNIDPTLAVIQVLKTVRPDLPILCGGPEVSFDTEAFLAQHPAVDLVITGEGEIPFRILMEQLAGGIPAGQPSGGYSCTPAQRLAGGHFDPAAVPGLAWRRDGEVIVNPPVPPPRNLDCIPFPYQEDLDAGGNDLRQRTVYYETSRGCPFACGFCLSSTTAGLRYFSLERVREELARLLAAGVREIKFVDRTFNAHKKRALAIWEYIASLRPKARFYFEIAGDRLDEEILAFLDQVPPGLFQFEIGVQTIDPQVNSLCHRNQDWESLAANVLRLREMGNIRLHLDLITGLPGEGYAGVGKSFDAVAALKPDEIQLGFLKLLKGTSLRARAGEFGYRYVDRPPYEVLASNAITYSEMLRLHDIETVLKYYGNSHLADHAFAYLVKTAFASSYFACYEILAAWWEEQGFFRKGHNQRDLFNHLATFAAALAGSASIARPAGPGEAFLEEQARKPAPEQPFTSSTVWPGRFRPLTLFQLERFYQLLKFDFLCRDRSRHWPGWVPPSPMTEEERSNYMARITDPRSIEKYMPGLKKEAPASLRRHGFIELFPCHPEKPEHDEPALAFFYYGPQGPRAEVYYLPLPKHPLLDLRGKYKNSSPTDKLTTALIKERTAERSREKR
ncbi:Elongator protein 3/MiaB/NifB [Moorella glycerini]|uniref:Coproporphyrinogen III oxidase n=1 Tax=Neomoorella stamsii TaxID=1266720 RepID=A0A9X7P6T2_9FIRM|nr:MULTISPECIES: B12-binding domain-containing radical SAM protein [Moorella]PRR73736.1 coproporphyrinogen III oxidase [Moorella stamsii]CEP66318.1 Elongator protein 3/MiaB/NifB [Moorella glycerini]